ncbi:MAG: SpoIIE family protein phosphatase [Desulfuromonadales bacterium]
MVASGRDLQSILDEILKIFTDQFKFDLCVIRILDEDRQTLTVRSQRGMTSEHFGESERDLTNETFIGETFLTNNVSVVNDCDYISKPKTAAIIRREKILSFAHAPIAVEGQPIGVLSAFSRTAKGIFTNEFVELFTSLAGQVGVAWRNAKQTEDLIAAKEQQRELEIAKNIQLSLLPTRVPKVPGIRLGGVCVPAKEVGGDYYDYLYHEDGRLDLVIADVSGHNVGAALIMAEARTMIRSRSGRSSSPKEMLKELNEFLHDDLSKAELFITLFYLHYHPETRQISYASAGHSPTLLWQSATEECARLDPEGLIIGVKKNFPYEQQSQKLAPGDVVLLYTDGLIEAANSDQELFGEARLAELLKENHHLQPEQLIKQIFEQVELFTGHQNFLDDVSMVVLQVEK